MKIVSISSILLVLLCFAACGEPLLPGHYQKIDDIAKNCQWACIATFQSLGNADPGPSGCFDYDSKWKITKVIKGRPEGDSFNFIIQIFPKEHAETLPVVGRSYILLSFGSNIDPQQIAYMMNFTLENEQKVTALLNIRK